jgi:mono/diheme cytochrome c family protein
MAMKSLILFLAALPLVVCAAPPPALFVAPPAEPAAAAGAPFDLSEAARVAVGKKRFGSTCAAYCHGAEGDGGKTPSFRARANFSPAETYKVISEGRRGTDIMPPWGGAFSPEEIWELVAYLQFLSTLPPKQ